ncbi:helix-turn-helix transcriptional regulator [Falsiroseomonas sp. HW251]|uniref:helix-turn-helix transcriptional regulator n=1 Tax=Falsiroseomonas sp. HW251 TaxID=3390998 RepID=UPI003D31BE07
MGNADPTRPVVPVTFDTAPLPQKQRMDAWLAAFGALNTLRLARPAEDPVLVLGRHWRLEGMTLSANRVPDSRFEREGAQARRDGLDHWAIRVLRQGRSHVRHPSFSAVVGPCEPILFSMHETWTTDWEGAEWVSLTIPRDHNPQLSAGLSALPRGPLRGPGAGLLAQMLLSLPAELDRASEADLPTLAEAARAMVAACLLTGLPRGAAEAEDLRKERVRQAIRQNLASARLSPARLSALTGLSRSTLYRLFDAEGGVARHIQDVRLSFAHAALRDPRQADRGVSEIAVVHGFPDPSVFARAFRRAFGVPPSAVRTAPAGLAPSCPVRVKTRKPGAPDSDLVGALYGRSL